MFPKKLYVKRILFGINIYMRASAVVSYSRTSLYRTKMKQNNQHDIRKQAGHVNKNANCCDSAQVNI